jgi:hypothetical protein
MTNHVKFAKLIVQGFEPNRKPKTEPYNFAETEPGPFKLTTPER